MEIHATITLTGKYVYEDSNGVQSVMHINNPKGVSEWDLQWQTDDMTCSLDYNTATLSTLYYGSDCS